jgi:hypothetical protein
MSAPKPTESDELETTTDDLPPVIGLTPEESREIFEQEAREIAVESRDILGDEDHWDLPFLLQAVARG